MPSAKVADVAAGSMHFAALNSALDIRSALEVRSIAPTIAVSSAQDLLSPANVQDASLTAPLTPDGPVPASANSLLSALANGDVFAQAADDVLGVPSAHGNPSANTVASVVPGRNLCAEYMRGVEVVVQDRGGFDALDAAIASMGARPTTTAGQSFSLFAQQVDTMQIVTSADQGSAANDQNGIRGMTDAIVSPAPRRDAPTDAVLALEWASDALTGPAPARSRLARR
jgi:hypothetical protein